MGEKSLPVAGATWCLIWLFLNIATTLLNKALFSNFDFPFPIIVSMIHMIFTAGLSLLSIFAFGYPTKSLNTRQHVGLAAFSALFCANIVIGNLGIRYATVALGQVIRASIPGITMILSVLLLGKRYTHLHVIAVAVVVFGVSMATYGDLQFHMLGFVLTVLGCFLSAAKSITSSIYLVGDLKFHPIELAFRMSAFAAAQMAVLAYCFGEFEELAGNWEHYWNHPNLTSMLCVNGLMAFLLNYSNFMFTRSTSALTVTVAGSVKNVLTILLSIFIFVTPVSPLNALGTFITIVGASMYSAIDHKHEQLKKKSTTSLPTCNSQAASTWKEPTANNNNKEVYP